MLVELTELDAFAENCLSTGQNLLLRREAYHPYRQSVVIILSIFMMIAISRWEIAYIVDQDQNVGLNRPLRSGFHLNDLYLWIRNREPVKDHVD